MKIRIWLYHRDNGDGSASSIFCKSKEEADKLAQDEEDSEYCQAFCDNVDSKVIETDDFEKVS